MSRVGREEIERPDFPSARRGYDRAAVDAHLRRAAERSARDHGRASEGVEDAAHGKLDRLQAELDRLLGGPTAPAETLTGPRGEVGTLGGAPGPEPPAASTGR